MAMEEIPRPDDTAAVAGGNGGGTAGGSSSSSNCNCNQAGGGERVTRDEVSQMIDHLSGFLPRLQKTWEEAPDASK